MKRTVLALLIFVLSVSAFSQRQMVIHNTNGTNSYHLLSTIDSVTFMDALMVPVEGGTFQMGSNDALDYGASSPHTVMVGSFFIDKYEITYAKWDSVRIWGVAHGYIDLAGVGIVGFNPVGIAANNPVSTVNWYDVVKWCNARSEMDGLMPVYYTSDSFLPANIYRSGTTDLTNAMVCWTANGYRLPTEAEWEFAAKGGTKAQSSPYTYSGSNIIDIVAWCSTNSGSTTHPVGEKSANELGLFDMSGNLWEWCWDWYASYTGTTQRDPRGPDEAQECHVLRGGSFYDTIDGCRSAYRCPNVPNIRTYPYGFRCVQQ